MQEELRAYSVELVEKPALVVANKVDKLKSKAETLAALRQHTPLLVAAVSALPGVAGFDVDAVEALKQKLAAVLTGQNPSD